MTSTEIAAASKIMLGTTEAVAMYIGSNKIWELKTGPVDTISEYVLNGLIFHLDGINKGTGADWVDLVGNKNFTIYGTGITSQSNSYYFDKTNPSYLKWSGPPFNESEYTVEVCMYPSENTYYVFGGGQRNSGHPLFYYNGSVTWGLDIRVFRNVGLTSGSKYTVSVNNDRLMKNGVEFTTTLGTDFWDVVDEQRIQIGKGSTGGAANNPFGGYLYSIRIYNRKLTREEQLQNQIIDDQRFNLGLYLGYIENLNVENGSHMYINKNFHFISSHTYKVETKIKWLNNTSNQDGDKAFILGLGKYKKSTDVDGYRIYWHSNDNIYRYGLGVDYSNSGSASTEKIISDQITGLTNEYYLTLFSNIRAYTRKMANALIYYVKITDVTTDTVICNLVPKYNATRNIYYMQDTTDNSTYQFITLGSSMREESDLTIYENET